MKRDPFKEYILEKEPTKKELGYSWYTAIGLQKVDGLETSDYLKSVAINNINGNITIEKAEELIKSYYIENTNHDSIMEEADKVAVNIAKILSEKSFIFSPAQYLDIHKKLFYNVFSHAGKIRTYNISKKEWVLDGDTVIYGGASLLKETLNYDFEVEKSFDYSNLNKNEKTPLRASPLSDPEWCFFYLVFCVKVVIRWREGSPQLLREPRRSYRDPYRRSSRCRVFRRPYRLR